MKKKRMILVCLAALLAILLVGCATRSFEQLKSDEYVGDRVVVAGTVDESIKIGDLSGFMLVDDAGETIKVSSDALPAEGDNVRVKGTLLKDSIFGYYIKSES